MLTIYCEKFKKEVSDILQIQEKLVPGWEIKNPCKVQDACDKCIHTLVEEKK